MYRKGTAPLGELGRERKRPRPV